jgi:ABC-type Zn uptake system ZnuABC Zn-binding protein ZnuA
MRSSIRRRLPVALVAALLVASCRADAEPEADGLLVVTTVAPLTDVVSQVARGAATVEGVVPAGVDSHTFEPGPSTARTLARADVVFLNGLQLEEPTREMAEANVPDGTPIVALGDRVLPKEDYAYDFSFPEEEGMPNPHVWMDPTLTMEYVQIVADTLVELDPDNASTYRDNASASLDQLRLLDATIGEAIATIPQENRVLLTYHDSWPYFARRYGMEVVGAIQPSDFSEPSAREVADLIEQLREREVPAIFGSEVFPSRVLDQIAAEADVQFVETLSDDELPGQPDDPLHSYVGMMIQNVRTMVRALGGDPSPLDGVPLEPGPA